ncbi:MAG: DUF2796 domain-containing protein [Candidatus Competibacteraceae bacterium]|nr:DUF2796 domain-containing protein [Candidatus Competibacteraceae bacterium]
MSRFIHRMVGIAMGGTFAVSVSAQSPHEHGTANLNIAVDSNDILLEFISPAVNIIGFEHLPNNAEQQHVLDDAVALLHNPAQLFALPSAAGCSVTLAELVSDLLPEHEEAHEHEDITNGQQGEEHLAHAEFHASYQFSCTDPAQLNAVELTIFIRFPGLEKINVQFIGTSGQLGAELTPAQPRLTF